MGYDTIKAELKLGVQFKQIFINMFQIRNAILGSYGGEHVQGACILCISVAQLLHKHMPRVMLVIYFYVTSNGKISYYLKKYYQACYT